MTDYAFWEKTSDVPGLTKEEIFHLGESVIIWGQIEYEIQWLIWEYLACGPEKGILITAGQPLRTKIELLTQLVERHEGDDQLKNGVLSTIKRVASLQPNRNVLVHGCWTVMGPVSGKKIIRSGDHPWGHLPDNFPLEKFATDSGAVACELHTIRHRKVAQDFSVLQADDD